MAIGINITIGRDEGLPDGTETEQAPETSGPGPSKLIDRGPEVEVSHSSDREATREIYEMVGRQIWVSSCLREEGIQLDYRRGVLDSVKPFDDGGGFRLSFRGDEDREVYPPLKIAVDRHVENGLVVLRTASGFEMELQVIGGQLGG